MRKYFLLALPIASFMLLAGCDQSGYTSSSGYSSPSSSSTQASASQTQTATTTTYQPPRNSTTQNLPSGWNYIHEQDLTGGRLPAGTSGTASTIQTGGGGS